MFDEDNLPTPPTSCITDVGSSGQKHVQFDLTRNMRSSVSSTPARGDAPNFTTQLPNFDVSHIPKLAPTNVQEMNISHVGNVTESSSFIKTMEEAARELKKNERGKDRKIQRGLEFKYCIKI